MWQIAFERFMLLNMSNLKNKTILLISPQSWGTMFVAKHHYAIELAKLGNEVYFLNPPDNDNWNLKSWRNRIRVEQSGIDNLQLIWHELYFPFILKFHAKKVFDFFMRRQITNILSALNKPVDIVWSFDLGNLYPLSNFTKAYKIFHPVDEPRDAEAVNAAKGADIIFGVTKEILEKYQTYPVAKHFINHGVSEYFFNTPPSVGNGSIRVGMSGNLLRPDIDQEILLRIIRENPQVVFEVWGNYDISNANLGAADGNSRQFINSLKSFPNVLLHGSVSSTQLPNEFGRMDAFLICYDIEKDQSKGTNYHKIMEYLSTGKVVISNNVTTYKEQPDLIQMAQSRDNNGELPDLFRRVIKELNIHNSTERQEKRSKYAFQNLYSEQLAKIASLISSTGQQHREKLSTNKSTGVR